MTDQPYWNQSYTLADGETLPINVEGSYFRLIAATGDLQIRINNAPAYPVPVAIGIHVPDGFDRLQVVNRSGGSVVFTLAIAEGEISDDRLSVSGTLSTSIVVATAIDARAVSIGVAATLIDALDLTRKSITLYNNGANVIYIGGAAVAVADGTPIAVGGSLTLDKNTAELYGISTVAAQDLRILVEA